MENSQLGPDKTPVEHILAVKWALCVSAQEDTLSLFK